MKILTIVSLFLMALFPLLAQSEHRSGTIDRIQGNDIIVKYDNPERPFAIGEKLHVMINNETVTLVVTFPMETSAKCRLYQIDLKSLPKGMIVYDGKAIAGITKPVENTQKSAINSSTIFKDNGDGTITDTRSGLMWLKDANLSNKKMNYNVADLYCTRLKYAGYSDWHIPSKSELESLFDGFPVSEGYIQKFLTAGFENVQEMYWTSTFTYGWYSATPLRLTVDSNIMKGVPSSSELSVWPVRSTKR